jgi:hypothetical protein
MGIVVPHFPTFPNPVSYSFSHLASYLQKASQLDDSFACTDCQHIFMFKNYTSVCSEKLRVLRNNRIQLAVLKVSASFVSFQGLKLSPWQVVQKSLSAASQHQVATFIETCSNFCVFAVSVCTECCSCMLRGEVASIVAQSA